MTDNFELMPDFISNMFGLDEFENKNDDKSGSIESKNNPEKKPNGEKRGLFGGNKREKKSKELKFLGSYCTNLSQKAADGELDNISCISMIHSATKRQYVLSILP